MMLMLHLHSLRIIILCPRILPPPLPLPRPAHQLLPIPALMLRPEPRHPADLGVFHLDGHVRPAHQTVPD